MHARLWLAVLAAAAACCLLPCSSAQDGVTTSYFNDSNCSVACDNCTVRNPIVSAGGCVRERTDTNSSSTISSCNITHVVGLTYNSSDCSGAATPYAYEVNSCRRVESGNASFPVSFYAVSVCPAQPSFASLAPKYVQSGAETRLTITGTKFAVSPSSNCSASFSLPPSLTSMSFTNCSVANSTLMYLVIPATASRGLDFSFSIKFSNLASRVVSSSNLSVVLYPTLQAVLSPTFVVPGDIITMNGSNFNPSLPCTLFYRQNSSSLFPFSSCVVVNSTQVKAGLSITTPLCYSCPLCINFPDYADTTFCSTVNITVVSAPIISNVNPLNLPIGFSSSSIIPIPVVSGLNFPSGVCRGAVCNVSLQYCESRNDTVLNIKTDALTPVCPNTTLAVYFDGFASPAIFSVSTVPQPIVTSIIPFIASSGSMLTIIGSNFIPLGPCDAQYGSYGSSISTAAIECNVSSSTTIQFKLQFNATPAMRDVVVKVSIRPSGKYPSPLTSPLSTNFSIIGSLMSSQLSISPQISRRNSTLSFILLSPTSLSSAPLRFISITSLPDLTFISYPSCLINGLTYADGVLTAILLNSKQILMEFTSVIPSSPNISCTITVQFSAGSPLQNVSITTSTGPLMSVNTTIDSCTATLPYVSGMTAAVAVTPPNAGQLSTVLAFTLTSLVSSTPIRFLSISSLPLFTSPELPGCTINGQNYIPIISNPKSGNLLLQLPTAVPPNSTDVSCTVAVQFGASGSPAQSILFSTFSDSINTTVDSAYATLPPIFSVIQGSFVLSTIVQADTVVLTLQVSRLDGQTFQGIGSGSNVSVNMSSVGVVCASIKNVVVAGQAAPVTAIASFSKGLLLVSILQGALTSASFSVDIPGCVNPVNIQPPINSLVVAISALASSQSTPSIVAIGTRFTFPGIVIGITYAAVIAPTATISSLTTLNFTVAVDTTFSSLEVAVSPSFTLPSQAGTLVCTAPTSTSGTWTSTSASGSSCAPFKSSSCTAVTLAVSPPVPAGGFVCAITGVITAAIPVLPVELVNYPMILRDSSGTVIAASYNVFLSGLVLKNFIPPPPAIIFLTIRPLPPLYFTATAFTSSLAAFLSCSTLQITLSSIVTQTGVSFTKSLRYPALPIRSPTIRQAGDVSFSVTFSASPYITTSVSPAILLQNVTAAFSSNSSNPMFVALGILSLKVIDSGKNVTPEEGSAKNQSLLIIGVCVGIAVIIIMAYVFYKLGAGVFRRLCKCCRSVDEDEEALYANAEASITGGRPSRRKKGAAFEMH